LRKPRPATLLRLARTAGRGRRNLLRLHGFRFLLLETSTGKLINELIRDINQLPRVRVYKEHYAVVAPVSLTK
jgi:hypothetical protein